MTTDITELAQNLKAAAEKAKHAGEAPIMSFDARISALNEYLITACPGNILALVEALEKAQKQISRLESRSVKLPKAMSIEGGAYCSAHAHYDSDGDYYDRTDVEEMLAAAGIKVEAE